MRMALFDGAGEIVTWGSCADPSAVDVPPGLGLVTSDEPMSNATHHVASGAPVAYTAEQAAAKADRPKARGFAWSNTTMTWEDARTLTEAKAQKRQELAGAWKAAMAAGVTIGGKVALTDSSAWVDYLTLRLMAQEAGWVDTPIELADGSFELLTQAKAATLWDALKVLRRTQTAKLRDKSALVTAAATVEAVSLIAWE